MPVPGNIEEAISLLWLLIGAFLGYLRHFLLWIPFGVSVMAFVPVLWPFLPFTVALGAVRYVALIAIVAAQESRYQAAASGDSGRSRGILQIYDLTKAEITAKAYEMAGGVDDWRLSPFWSGYYSAEYVNNALMTTPIWGVWFALPFVDVAAIRRLWTHGYDIDSAMSVLMSTDDIEQSSVMEQKEHSYFALSVVVTLTVVSSIWAFVASFRTKDLVAEFAIRSIAGLAAVFGSIILSLGLSASPDGEEV